MQSCWAMLLVCFLIQFAGQGSSPKLYVAQVNAENKKEWELVFAAKDLTARNGEIDANLKRRLEHGEIDLVFSVTGSKICSKKQLIERINNKTIDYQKDGASIALKNPYRLIWDIPSTQIYKPDGCHDVVKAILDVYVFFEEPLHLNGKWDRDGKLTDIRINTNSRKILTTWMRLGTSVDGGFNAFFSLVGEARYIGVVDWSKALNGGGPRTGRVELPLHVPEYGRPTWEWKAGVFPAD